MIVFRSADGRWRIECTDRSIRVFEVGSRGGQAFRHECRSPRELDAWLRRHAGLGLGDLAQD